MLQERYEGTALGRQELYAEVIEQFDGALWTPGMIEEGRLHRETEKELTKIIVAIDPAVTAKKNSDETGIIVVGRDALGDYYVLEDISGRYTPDKWARIWGGNVKFATLTENLASKFGSVSYSCDEVNKAEEDVWLVYPWENVGKYD